MTFSEYLQKHKCIGTPQLRLLAENDEVRVILCLTCYEEWTITRSKLKAWAREENRLDHLRRMSEAEHMANAKKIFGAHYAGVHHGE